MQHQRPTVALALAVVIALIFLCHLFSPPPRAYARRYQGINRCSLAQTLILTNLAFSNTTSVVSPSLPR